MMAASFSNRATSASVKRAPFSGSKPRKALRNASRLLRMVTHERPAWKPLSMSDSQSARLSNSGTPHSRSWYVVSSSSSPTQAQRMVIGAALGEVRVNHRDIGNIGVESRDFSVSQRAHRGQVFIKHL